MIRELLLLLYSFNIQDFIFLITSAIDIFAATIIAVSTFQAIIPMVKVTIMSTLDVRNRLPSSSSAQNGFELYRQIKKIDNRVKICFLKANEMSYIEYEDIFRRLDESCFIQKPIENEELIARLNKIIIT